MTDEPRIRSAALRVAPSLSFDEDPLTIAYAAAWPIRRDDVRALYTPVSARLLEALDLHAELTPVGGAAALRIALAIPKWPALVVDQGAAFLVGPGPGARVRDWITHSEPIEPTDDARFAKVRTARLVAMTKRDARVGPLPALAELLETGGAWTAIDQGFDSAIVEGTAPVTRVVQRPRANGPFTPPPSWTSPQLEARDAEFLHRLHGLKCECGFTQTIPTPACGHCGSTKREPVKLARTGRVFTFTHESYVPPQVTMLVVDLDGGGRILVQQADEGDAAIGARVRLVLRKLHAGYYWKAVLE